ncbi:hypothetical protein QYE76_065092 [Lolium multiflorum]|uniref:Zinc finger, CCHC-type n=1 Tax=Lolium multiflorum TaxID=4521 RepID=A0AAD8S879_LOLMU|nr:hypothetical protein QYE76_065092 [Lolium multiflorum]
MRELKLIFETHAAVESYEASKQFFSCMMEEGSSVSEHMFAMSGHAKKLSDMGMMIPNQLGIHRVLQSLPPSYKNFVMNYNMQNMNKDLPELFSMLKSAEVEIKKENQVLMVNKTTSFKRRASLTRGKGHWKRNCSKYLAYLKSDHVKKKGGVGYLSRDHNGGHDDDYYSEGEDGDENDGGPPDLPIVNSEVQPPELGEEEAIELAMAHSELQKLA